MISYEMKMFFQAVMNSFYFFKNSVIHIDVLTWLWYRFDNIL